MSVSSAPSFGDLLKKHRVAAGVTQEGLAEKARVSANAISSLERGARRAPHRDTVALLARALGLDGPDRDAFESAAESVRVRVPVERAGSPLPVQLTLLVGREKDLARILDLVSEHRLVTITGAGGIGKTRLAIAVAQRLADERDAPAWFVDLAAVRTEIDVVSKIAAAVGVTIGSSADLIDDLIGSLKRRSGSMVLDNCEHVIEAAAVVAAAIGRAAVDLSILATSRERLAISGERVYRLEALSSAAALELFQLRAASAGSGFTLTSESREIAADICGQIDGIPLAIELAAARVAFLGLGELRARLRGRLAVLSGSRRDLPARQQTMRDTVAWSYALLDPAERALFRRISIFAGGWSLDALELVAVAAPLDEVTLLASLSSLVEKSLVQVELRGESARYRLLEPVRVFAREQLEAAAELGPFSQRHAAWVASIAESGRTDVALFAREIDNARAALEWALGPNGDALLAARIAAGPGGAWARSGLLADGRRWCLAVLDRLGGDADPNIVAPVYRSLLVSIDSKDEIEMIGRALPYSERAGDWSSVAVLSSRLALRLGERARFDEAERAFQRVWQIYEQLGSPQTPQWSTVMMHRGSIYRREGRLDEADAAIAESLRLARALRKPLHEMWALLVAGEIAFARRAVDDAMALAGNALEICWRERHALGEIFSRANLAAYHLELRDLGEARMHAIAALALGRDVPASATLSAILHRAAIDALDGDAERAAVLRGYFDAARDRGALALDSTEANSHAILNGSLEKLLEPEAIALAGRRGAMLSAAEAAELAAGP